MGLRALALSDESGGAGADHLTACLVIEELAQGDPDIAVVVARTSVLAHLVFDEVMTAEQRGRFLPQFMDHHDFHLAFAREPDAGLAPHYHRQSPAAVAPVNAAKQGENWVINGEIAAVANAPIARLFVVEAEGSVLLVLRGTAGLAIEESGGRAASGGSGPVVRWHHGTAGKVVFKDCRVPAANRVSAGKAASAAREYAKRSAVVQAAANVGIGQTAFEAAVDYAKLRRQDGKHIIEHQAIGTLLAEIAIKLEVARNTVWKAAWALDHPEAVSSRSVSDLPLHHVARSYVGDIIVEVTERAAECFGAMGVMRDMPLQKYVSDALVFKHGEPGAGATKLLIAEAVAGFERG